MILLPVFMSSMGSSDRVPLPRSDWAYHGFFLCPFFPTGAQDSQGFRKRTLTHDSQSSRNEPLLKVIINFILTGLTFLNWIVMWFGQMYWTSSLSSVSDITWVLIPNYWVTNIKLVTGHSNKKYFSVPQEYWLQDGIGSGPNLYCLLKETEKKVCVFF